MTPRHVPALGDRVFYQRNAAMPSCPVLTDGWLDAVVTNVHTPNLVDLEVVDGEVARSMPFVPFLDDGDPDPRSLVGVCQRSRQRAAPAPRRLNPGSVHEFVIDPLTGEKL